MSIVLWILFGLVVGLIARAVMPGRQHMGVIATTLLGVAGSLIGGFVGAMLTHGTVTSNFSGAGLIGSILGALLLLFIAGLVTRGGPHTRGPIDRPV